MKNVLRLSATALALLLGTTFSYGQKFDLGIQLTPSIPMGDFSASFLDGGYSAEFGYGAQITADYYFNDNVHAGVEIGYSLYGVADIDESYTMLPIQLNGAYHLDASEDLDFYFGTGVGLFMFSSTVEGAESESYVGFTPRVGVSYELSKELRFNGNVSFAYVMTPAEDEDVTTGFDPVTLVPIVETQEVDPADISFLNINLGVTYTLWD